MRISAEWALIHTAIFISDSVQNIFGIRGADDPPSAGGFV